MADYSNEIVTHFGCQTYLLYDSQDTNHTLLQVKWSIPPDIEAFIQNFILNVSTSNTETQPPLFPLPNEINAEVC